MLRNVSDHTLLRWLAAAPALAIAAVGFAGVFLWTGGIAPPESRYGIVATVSFLAFLVSSISLEARRRAGGRVALKAWQASDGWARPEFVLHHDYDPRGADFQELLQILRGHGYVTPELDPGITRQVEWRFARSTAPGG